MKLKKFLLPAVVSFLLFGAGCSLSQTVNLNTTASVNVNARVSVCPTPSDQCLRYSGQDGKNALELLQANYTIDASAEGFVNAIAGVKPGDRQFWAFYLNGEQAQVGAKDYQTKNTDTIEWKLESY